MSCLLTALAALTNIAPLYAEPSENCPKNPKLGANEYLSALTGDIKNNLNPIFKRVPKDLAVVNKRRSYVVTNHTELRDLPMLASPGRFGLGQGYKFTSFCRVQGTAGDWWLAVRSKDGYLAYLPEQDAEPAAEYQRQNQPEPTQQN